MARHTALARSAAVLLLAAIAVTALHHHPGFDAEKSSTCPAAAWHAGAVLHGDASAPIAVALVELPAPSTQLSAPSLETALRPWSSRAPPRDA